MSFLARLFGARPDPRGALRPLWHRLVELAREPQWYTHGGIADTMPGRFDAVALVMALVMLRMDARPDLKLPSARLTELFVEDMDGQMRQSGVGDLVVGKRVAKLMSALGGRIEALRAALAQADDAALIAAIERNVTLTETAKPAAIAAELRVLASTLADTSDADLLAGRIAR
ncbi:ubiquinol-cytochrome C chaperone family protein [Novosphingobium sp.]|uniref:ubiquinol-cytochrome C chaperone family protein n=1 Tax=Novosphingobium sp. TaxID=1874826 RepID=UPI0025D91073|nr:ubiquinol-cytochrome C chaperone family protein [Novosphingobium sp.]